MFEFRTSFKRIVCNLFRLLREKKVQRVQGDLHTEYLQRVNLKRITRVLLIFRASSCQSFRFERHLTVIRQSNDTCLKTPYGYIGI